MMKRAAKRIAVAMVLSMLFGTGFPQRVKVEPDQKYLLLATTKTSTMQQELDEAAQMGFRVLVGSPTSGSEMALFLERVATVEKPYKYLLLATTRTKTMEKELNDASRENYRLLPSTMIAKAQLFGGVEIVVLLEREPDPQTSYEYKLLATSRTSTLQKEVTQAREEGFKLVGMVSRDEHIVIMEKATVAK